MKTVNLEKVIYKKYTGKLRVKHRPKYPWAHKFLLALFNKTTVKKKTSFLNSKPQYLPLFEEMAAAVESGSLKMRREGWNVIHLYHERQDFIDKFITAFADNCDVHYVVASNAVAQAMSSNRKLIVRSKLPKKKYRYKIKLKDFRLGANLPFFSKKGRRIDASEELFTNIVENFGDQADIDYRIMRWYREKMTKINLSGYRSDYGHYVWAGRIFVKDSENLTALLFMLNDLVREVEEYKTLEEFNETTISGNPTTTESA